MAFFVHIDSVSEVPIAPQPAKCAVPMAEKDVTAEKDTISTDSSGS